MLELWLGTFLVEAAVYWKPFWAARRLTAICSVAYICIATVSLWHALGLWLGLLPAIFGLFRCLNMARIVKNRMNTLYLKRVTARTSLYLFFLCCAALLILLPFLYITNVAITLLQVTQLISAIVILLITGSTLSKLNYKQAKSFLPDRDLPTVTVAIPARNETTDLEQCIKTVLANDYPKLEVIVLDDCSQASTADVIRGFAQDGVRFVPGDPPEPRWLAKNQAYQKLFDESSGDLILFIGVDTRLGPDAIRSMVNLLYSRKKSMLSVLPVRRHSSPASVIIQPMRYWWELAIPRRFINRPPVLSTCWMIGRVDLDRLGGFKAVSHAILPEIYFAREMVKNDQYSFARSSNELDVTTIKSFQEQYATAIRTRYPQVRRRPEMALFLTFVNMLLLLLPFVLLILSLWNPAINIWLALVTCGALIASHVLIVQATDPANSLLAAVTFPVDAFVEMVIGYISMVQYEFFTVEWKDRNICIPVMHVIPKLPELKL